MYFIRFFVFIALLFLSVGCNQDPADIDADDFGFPKTYVAATGKNVQGENENQYTYWIDTGLQIDDTDDLLRIVVSNKWTSWFEGDEYAIPNSSVCQYLYPDDLSIPHPDKPDSLAIVNAPCWLKSGIGLYILTTPPSIPNFNPNSTATEIQYPSSPTYHLAPNMPDAGTTPDGGWNNNPPADMEAGGRVYLKILDSYHDDNAGGYDVVFKSGVSSEDEGPIESTVHLVTDTFNGIARDIFINTVADSRLIEAIRATLLIYIIFTSVAFMFGLMDLTQGELVTRAFKIGVILALISEGSWDFFNDHLFSIFMGNDGKISGVEEIIGIILGGESEDGLAVFDSMWHTFTSEETTAKVLSLLFSQPEGFLFIILIYVAFGLFLFAMIRFVIYYILSVIAISLLIAVAPIFLTSILFSMTRSLYNEWLKQLISFGLQPIILFTALATIGELVMDELYSTLGYPVCWCSFIHIPYLGIDFEFWMPNVRQTDLEYIAVPPEYTEMDWRYVDLPFLDPENGDDADKIERIFNNGDTVTFMDIFILALVIYLMFRFSTLVPALARGLGGTANGLMNLEKPSGMLLRNLLNLPGQSIHLAGKVGAKAYDKVNGKNSYARDRKQLMGAISNTAPSQLYKSAVDKIHSVQDGIHDKVTLKSTRDAISEKVGKTTIGKAYNNKIEALRENQEKRFAKKDAASVAGDIVSAAASRSGAVLGNRLKINGKDKGFKEDLSTQFKGFKEDFQKISKTLPADTFEKAGVDVAMVKGVVGKIEGKINRANPGAKLAENGTRTEDGKSAGVGMQNARGNEGTMRAISALNAKIAKESDPVVRQKLEAERKSYIERIQNEALKQQLLENPQLAEAQLQKLAEGGRAEEETVRAIVILNNKLAKESDLVEQQKLEAERAAYIERVQDAALKQELLENPQQAQEQLRKLVEDRRDKKNAEKESGITGPIVPTEDALAKELDPNAMSDSGVSQPGGGLNVVQGGTADALDATSTLENVVLDTTLEQPVVPTTKGEGSKGTQEDNAAATEEVLEQIKALQEAKKGGVQQSEDGTSAIPDPDPDGKLNVLQGGTGDTLDTTSVTENVTSNTTVEATTAAATQEDNVVADSGSSSNVESEKEAARIAAEKVAEQEKLSEQLQALKDVRGGDQPENSTETIPTTDTATTVEEPITNERGLEQVSGGTASTSENITSESTVEATTAAATQEDNVVADSGSSSNIESEKEAARVAAEKAAESIAEQERIVAKAEELQKTVAEVNEAKSEAITESTDNIGTNTVVEEPITNERGLEQVSGGTASTSDSSGNTSSNLEPDEGMRYEQGNKKSLDDELAEKEAARVAAEKVAESIAEQEKLSEQLQALKDVREVAQPENSAESIPTTDTATAVEEPITNERAIEQVSGGTASTPDSSGNASSNLEPDEGMRYEQGNKKSLDDELAEKEAERMAAERIAAEKEAEAKNTPAEIDFNPVESNAKPQTTEEKREEMMREQEEFKKANEKIEHQKQMVESIQEHLQTQQNPSSSDSFSDTPKEKEITPMQDPTETSGNTGRRDTVKKSENLSKPPSGGDKK